jgi:hypothetical protein
MALLGSACKAAVEGFAGSNEDPAKRRAVYTEVLATLLAFIISLVILGFVGKLLWNNVVIELFSFAKPARSFWQILGLMVFISLVNP